MFRTHEPGRDRLIAVKAFRLDLVPEDAARLADSLRQLAASGLTHPNIVSPIDAGLEGTSAYLAMDYVAGETLDVALRHLAPAPLDRALPILAQAAQAIEAAQVLGFGHGALHPRDLFITPRTQDVRVTGFGVVAALEAVGVKPPVRRPYAAPERAAGGPWDIRADVYSLGAIAHELLTRRRPAGPGEQDGALATGTTPEQRVLIRRVLAVALAARPANRFASPAALVSALEAIARGVDVGVLPEPEVGPDVGLEQVSAGKDPDKEERRWSDEQARADEPKTSDEPAKIDEPAPTAEPAAIDVAHKDAGSEPKTDVAADARTAWWVSGPSQSEQPARHTTLRIADPTPSWQPPPAITVRSSFPWLVVAAAGIAGLVLGVVIGHAIDLGRSDAPAATAALIAKPPPDTAAPTDTDVPVPAPPAVAPPPGPTAAAALPPAVPSPAPPSGPPTESARAPAPVKPSPAAERAVVTGRILVRSVPTGAEITINGRARGATPLVLRDLPLGAHTLAVARSGYLPETQRVVLTSSEPARNLTFELRPASGSRPPAGQPPQSSVPAPVPDRVSAPATTRSGQTGSIYLDSRPRGARVVIDGVFVGTTPMLLPGVSVGTRAVRIELVGYQLLATTVRVLAGQQARLTATLEKGTVIPPFPPSSLPPFSRF